MSDIDSRAIENQAVDAQTVDAQAVDSKVYGNSWYAATVRDAPPRPPLSLDLDVDVCVIGGGLAGLTAAREIARSGWSVVLLESGRLAGGASGRNTGFVLPGFGADVDRLIERVGFERTKDLWALSQAGLDYVRNTVRSEGVSGIDPQDGWLAVSKVDNSDEIVSRVALLGELSCEIEGWPTERVRAVLRSERYFYAINYSRAFTVHPVTYARKLAAAAERDGARIFEDTPALSIDPTGVRKRIVTPGARLRANHVVLCGNVQLGALMPRLAATLLPVTTYVITTAPLGEGLAEAVGYRGGISDSDSADNHYRIVGGDRLMLSGRATAWVRDARRYVGALTGDIKKTYPQLGDVAVDYAWNGTLGLTLHRMPQIGELGPGVWLASGFGGHGLNTTAMAGNIIARGIVDADESWRQFTPFELVWAGGIFGRAAVQVRFLVKRLRAAIEERRAKARELAHRQARETALANQEGAPPVEAAEARALAEEEPVAPEVPPAPVSTAGSVIPPQAASEVVTDEATDDPRPQSTPEIAATQPRKRRKRRQRAKV
jgi:glycine/D-amino acid oxidase-like deaminating enzyme